MSVSLHQVRRIRLLHKTVSCVESKLILEGLLASTHIFRAYFTKTHLISSPVSVNVKVVKR